MSRARPHPPERIEVGELVLRRSTASDAERIVEAVAESLEHLRPWMAWASPEAASLARQHERLGETARGWEAGEEYTYLALWGEVVVGCFALERRVGPGAIELGYWLHPRWVGRGWASSCARALTEVALALPGVTRVEIHCDEANVRSQQIPRWLGYSLDRVEPDGVQAPAEVGRSMIWVFPPDPGACS